MKMKHNTIRLIFAGILLTAVILISSCSVKNEISLSTDGSGTATTDTVLDEALVFYLQSLAELTAETAGGPLFDTDQIRMEMEKNPGIEVVSLESFDDQRITAEISFDNIEELIAETESTLNKKIISFDRKGSEKEIRIYIDIDNFEDIAPLFPIVEEPLFQDLRTARESGNQRGRVSRDDGVWHSETEAVI